MAAIPRVRGFGTRRVLMSTSAPTRPLPATAVTIGTFRLFKHGVVASHTGRPVKHPADPRPERVDQRAAQLRCRHDRAEGDEAREQGVLDQVLARLSPESALAIEMSRSFASPVLLLAAPTPSKACEAGARARLTDRLRPRSSQPECACSMPTIAFHTALTCVPAAWIASTDASAISAARSAYSIRSWPRVVAHERAQSIDQIHLDPPARRFPTRLSLLRNFDRAFIAPSVDELGEGNGCATAPDSGGRNTAKPLYRPAFRALSTASAARGAKACSLPQLARTFVTAASNFVGRLGCGEMEQRSTHLSRPRVSNRFDRELRIRRSSRRNRGTRVCEKQRCTCRERPRADPRSMAEFTAVAGAGALILGLAIVDERVRTQLGRVVSGHGPDLGNRLARRANPGAAAHHVAGDSGSERRECAAGDLLDRRARPRRVDDADVTWR